MPGGEHIIVDGELRKRIDLQVDPLEIAFAYGFGLFETLRFAEGRPCFFEPHVKRLQRGIEAAGIELELNPATLRVAAARLLEADGAAEGMLKIVALGEVKPRLILFAREVGARPPSKPLQLELSPIVRASQAFTSRHKTLNYMDLVWELGRARERGVDELVYRNERGEVTESTLSNLFFVSRGRLRTPQLDCGLLDGIVRHEVLAAARNRGLPVEEGRYGLDELLQAEELFLTNSGRGVASVASLHVGGRSVFYNADLAASLHEDFLERERASLD